MPVTRHYTAADLATMPDDGQRYEIIRGELLVTPAPRDMHQLIVGRLYAELWQYLKPRGLADQLVLAPADITFAHNTVLEPDLFVADTTALLRTGNWTDVTMLFLVIEVISRSTGHIDRTTKRDEYRRHGVPRYWILDGEKRHVEIWTPDAQEPVIERERLVWRHPALDDGCVIDLVKLFDFGGDVTKTTHLRDNG